MTYEPDSVQLQRLRISFRYTSAAGVRASPARLGAYAAQMQRTITDFGDHSARWVRIFRGAQQKYLDLFNP